MLARFMFGKLPDPWPVMAYVNFFNRVIGKGWIPGMPEIHGHAGKSLLDALELVLISVLHVTPKNLTGVKDGLDMIVSDEISGRSKDRVLEICFASLQAVLFAAGERDSASSALEWIESAKLKDSSWKLIVRAAAVALEMVSANGRQDTPERIAAA